MSTVKNRFSITLVIKSLICHIHFLSWYEWTRSFLCVKMTKGCVMCMKCTFYHSRVGEKNFEELIVVTLRPQRLPLLSGAINL